MRNIWHQKKKEDDERMKVELEHKQSQEKTIVNEKKKLKRNFDDMMKQQDQVHDTIMAEKNLFSHLDSENKLRRLKKLKYNDKELRNGQTKDHKGTDFIVEEENHL